MVNSRNSLVLGRGWSMCIQPTGTTRPGVEQVAFFFLTRLPIFKANDAHSFWSIQIHYFILCYQKLNSILYHII